MPQLILMRHAKAGRPPGISDHARPLTARGRSDAALVAGVLRDLGLSPNFILASDSTRTRETVAIIAPMFAPLPETRVDRRLYLADEAAILAAVHAAAPCDRLMIVGHNPGLATLALALTGHGPAEDVRRLAEGFPTSAAAVLAFDGAWPQARPRAGRLTRFITAKALRPPPSGD